MLEGEHQMVSEQIVFDLTLIPIMFWKLNFELSWDANILSSEMSFLLVQEERHNFSGLRRFLVDILWRNDRGTGRILIFFGTQMNTYGMSFSFACASRPSRIEGEVFLARTIFLSSGMGNSKYRQQRDYARSDGFQPVQPCSSAFLVFIVVLHTWFESRCRWGSNKSVLFMFSHLPRPLW